jgi:cytochrome c oxidase assembly protein subunit 15
MWVFLIITVVLLLRLAKAKTPSDILRRGYYLLLVIVIQGGIGYTQYELGIPAWLVLAHIAGATLLVGTVLWFHLGLSSVMATDSSATEAPTSLIIGQSEESLSPT